MTTIAWRDQTLAADRWANSGDVLRLTTKLRRLKDAQNKIWAVVAWVGTEAQGLTLADWYHNGADPKDWPAFQQGEEWTRLIVMEQRRLGAGVSIFEFEKLPCALEVSQNNPHWAWGSGREFALGAMDQGASAVEAVEIASAFDPFSGGGVDEYTFGVRL